MPWQTETRAPSDALSCTSCASRLVYDPVTQCMTCATCGAVRSAGTGDSIPDLSAKQCRTCGARMCGNQSALSAPCGFCGAGLVSDNEAALDWPDAIIPFRLSYEKAGSRLRDWLFNMPSPPSGITKFAETDRPLRSVYLPFYRFTHLAGRQESITARSACPQLSRFLGKGDLLELVWSKLPIRPFHADFVTGHVVTLPQLPMQQAIEQERHHKAKRINYGEAGSLVPKNWTMENCQRVLAPVWLGSYRWDNERYAVTIDGVTGEIIGTRPDEGLGDIRVINWLTEWSIYGVVIGAIAYVAIAELLNGPGD